MAKVFKTLDFWFVDTWNNIDQLQRSGSCIRIPDVGIWVGKIWTQILLQGHKSISLSIYTHTYIYIYRERGRKGEKQNKGYEIKHI